MFPGSWYAMSFSEFTAYMLSTDHLAIQLVAVYIARWSVEASEHESENWYCTLYQLLRDVSLGYQNQ